MHESPRALLLLVAGLLTFGNGCVKKYVEIRVRDGGRVGVGATAGPSFVPVLAPDGSQGMVTLPASGSPVAVARQGREIVAIWPGTQPLELVNGAGAFPPMRPGEGIELRGGSLYAYYHLMPKKVYSAGDQRAGSVPIALSTPANNVAEAIEIHEPYHWPAYVFIPTGGVFALVGSSLLVIRTEETQIVGWTYAGIGVPMLIYGIINALQTSEAVPVELVRGVSF